MTHVSPFAIAIFLTFVALVLLGLTAGAIAGDGGQPKHEGWEGEHTQELDQILAEHHSGELPTLDALSADGSDDTQILNQFGTRPADDTLPDWAQQRTVDVPVCVPVADETVVITTEGYTGRHWPHTVDLVDAAWWPVPARCAQYPRRGA